MCSIYICEIEIVIKERDELHCLLFAEVLVLSVYTEQFMAHRLWVK